jgi:NADP-dependent 3-hydroxy acid dehydrogenase YdfG
MKLEGKMAPVTGGGTGIGTAIAERLAQKEMAYEHTEDGLYSTFHETDR